MKINIFKNIGKYFTHQSSCAGRVASSAKMLGIKGSATQRAQLAGELNDKLFRIIGDEFVRKMAKSKKAKLSKEELARCINKIVPGVKVVIKSEKNPRCLGSLDQILSRKKVTGYILRLNDDVKKGENESILRHEMRHLLDYATQPKLSARSNIGAIIKKLGNGSDSRMVRHWDFYSDTLYEKKVYEDNQKELSELVKKVNFHFKALRTPAEEKIEILQNWRNGLKTESNAYADEARFACKKNPDKYTEKDVGDFLFEGKIKMVNQMLKDEIAAVRKESALKFGPKSPSS
jgi:hypothetical protein